MADLITKKSEELSQPARCLNCDTILAGPYCHNCSQKVMPAREAVGDMFINFISSFWSYEGKFWQTTYFLLLKPGRLPLEYSQGRRERYFHPARLYVFISFVFFLVLAMVPSQTKVVTAPDSMLQDSVKGRVYSYNSLGLQFGIRPNFNTVDEYYAAQAKLPEAQRDGWFGRLMTRREIEIGTTYKTNEEFQQEFGSAYSENVSKVFFWLLPFFALLLKLFYIRRDFYFSQHLIFSVYYYNFFFLSASIFFLLGLIPGVGSFSDVMMYASAFIYLYIAMLVMYKQSWWKTLGKFVLFVACFIIFISLGMLANLFATMMLI